MSGHTVKAVKGWSIQELATEFGINRATVRRQLQDVEPRGPTSTANYKTYRIADVAYPLGLYCAKGIKGFGVGEQAAVGLGDGQMHPDELPPKERKEWYDGEKVRKGMLRDDRLLIPDSEHRAALAELAQVIRMHLTNQADNIDAAFTVPPEIIDAIDKENDAVLHSIADMFAGDGPDDMDEADDE